MSAEQLFYQGAEAMRAEIVARFMMRGQVSAATDVLKMPLPAFKLSETQIVSDTDKKDNS